MPTKLKILRGNPGKRKIDDREPRPASAVPPCPKLLVGEARKEWRRVSKLLDALGLLTHLDRAALTAYCQCWARWVDAEGKVNQLGAVVLRPAPLAAEGEEQPPPEFMPNPYLRVAEASLKQLTRLLAEFGLTPSSRTRLSSPAPSAQRDEMEDFLASG